jgi:hypothetical protein
MRKFIEPIITKEVSRIGIPKDWLRKLNERINQKKLLEEK